MYIKNNDCLGPAEYQINTEEDYKIELHAHSAAVTARETDATTNSITSRIRIVLVLFDLKQGMGKSKAAGDEQNNGD